MPSSSLNQVSDEHVKKAWEYVFRGVPPEQAAELVLPPGDGPVGSMNRGVYSFALVTVLSRKKLLFGRAVDAVRTGGDWRRVFRGRVRSSGPLRRSGTNSGSTTSSAI